jgi:hypothetical protein
VAGPSPGALANLLGSKALPPVDKHPRTTHEHGNHVHICVYNYSVVDVIKQRNMVNSGVRGTKDKNLRSRCIGKLL